MANILNEVEIKNHTNLNSFDLSENVCYTAKVGEILPVSVKEVMPRDKFRINLSHFSRTQPLQNASFLRLKENIDFFFVPYRLLWRYFPQFITDVNTNFQWSITNNGTTHLPRFVPHINTNDLKGYFGSTKLTNVKNIAGYNHLACAAKLLEYLGYSHYGEYNKISTNLSSIKPNARNQMLSLMPLLAYQKIYSDYFRRTQWETAEPLTFNADYAVSDASIDLQSIITNSLGVIYEDMFSLRYCNLNKDLYNSLLPRKQFGNTAEVDITSTVGNVSLQSLIYSNQSLKANDEIKIDSQSQYTNFFTIKAGTPNALQSPAQILVPKSNLVNAVNNIQSSFDVLQLRMAQALQKSREIKISNDLDFVSQIESIFGVKPAQFLANLCERIGGNTWYTEVNPQVNTNLSGDNQAELKATASANGDLFINWENKTNDYGLLIGVYYAQPLHSYAPRQFSPSTMRCTYDQFANPLFDKLGNEAVYNTLFMSPDKTTSQLLGYSSRYAEYKTSIDVVKGDFHPDWGSQKDMVVINELKNAFTLGSNANAPFATWYKCVPSIVDNIFAVKADDTYKTDQIQINDNVGIQVLRALDVNGLPY